MSRWLLVGVLAGYYLHGAGRVDANGPPAVDSDVRQAVGKGLARVLVEVRTSPTAQPEGGLTTPGAVATQRAAIAAAQGDILSRLPRSHFALIRRYESVPFLALQIDADALRALEAMGDVVARVLSDQTFAPTTRQ